VLRHSLYLKICRRFGNVHDVNDRIRQLCRLIEKETDNGRLAELARELEYALHEHSLQAQNKAFAASQQIGALQ